MNKYLLTAIFLSFFVCRGYASEIVIEPSGTNNDSDLIQNTLDGLMDGDTLILHGDFIIAGTIYLPSNITWILNGSVTLASDADLDEVGWVNEQIDASRRTGITEKVGGATNIDMSGGIYYGNSANYLNSMRYLNFVSVTNSSFHDMHITEVTDDNFTLGPGCNNNECRNLVGSFSKSGNALTDKGHHNTWIDCIASDCGSDGWTPKCQFSTFIRCIAADNVGPGFGMYAREEGYADNKDVGAHIIGNKFYDCVSYGSLHSSGFSFNISSNCPGAIIRDNFIQAVCYDNQKSGVSFRNKDDAELGIIEDNVVDIICYGNKGLNKSGNTSSWAGGLGMENDNSTMHNLIENITGSVICYDNRIDVNTRGGRNCNIKVYHPEGVKVPILDDKISGNNTVTVFDFNCDDQLEAWCHYKYCGAQTPNLPDAPSDLSASVVSASQIDLSWTDNSEDEDGFRIEQKTTDSYVKVATVDANITSFSSIDLRANTKYTYRAIAYNISGNSDYSNETSATTAEDSTTSIVDQVTGSDIKLICYPNPSLENTQIKYYTQKDCFVSLKVFDSIGRKLKTLVNEYKQQGIHTATLNTGQLPAGTYYCRLAAAGFSETIKITSIK